MSAKVKFSSNASTPVKARLSEYSSATPSPVKGSKYKNFLTAVLTPSKTKQWLKRKKSTKSDRSKDGKAELEESYKGSQVSDDFNDPAYSSIQELRLKQSYPGSNIDSGSVLSENIQDPSGQFLSPLQINVGGEPLYSTVNKQRKKNSSEDVISQDNSFYEQSSERTHSEHMSMGLTKTENAESVNKRIVEEQKEEIQLLVERMKELTKENRELRKNIETIIKEEKWKEDSLHAELKLKITQLEADTHMEVKCLSEQIKTLQKERKVLTEQIHILHEEKKSLHDKYEDACKKVRAMVSPDFMKKVVDEHEMLLNQIKKKHLEEVKKLQKENEVILESKISFMGEVEVLKEKVESLKVKNEALISSEQELLQEKNRILFQLEESKQMQQDAQNMLLSLLKMAENISVERDILLNKASFQDHQQKLLQSTVMDYSINMGRLQEHISNLNREKLEELHKLRSGESQRDESLKSFYGKQLDILHSKVLNQTNTINDLESEKSKLELQLESLWQAACGNKSKVEDIK